ncbi:MAG: hypothetical protein KAV82_14010 [Phycisphaerae bacterium]|nr:hypothetical protein [Phycisphaerae bacterium]
MRSICCPAIAIVLVLAAGALGQTTIDSTWDGTSGTWVTSNGWDVLGGTDPYPANNVSYIYNVTLPGGFYALSMEATGELELLNLEIDAGVRLDLNDSLFSPGLLTQNGVIDLSTGVLELSAAVSNSGVIRFDLNSADAEAIVVTSSLTLSGDGKIVFRDNDPLADDPSTAEIVTSNGYTLTNGTMHSIEGGPGTIRGDGLGAVYFVNDGTVLANVPFRTLLLDWEGVGLTVTNHGEMIAEDLGMLQVVGASLANDGDLLSDSGTLDFDGVTISGSGSLVLAYWGVVDFDSMTTATFATIDNLSGIIPSTGAGLTTDIYAGAGALTVDSNLTVNSVMTLDAGTELLVGDGARINIGDRLVNEMTVEADFDFGTNGELRFTSATGALPYEYDLFGTLEAAGADMGDVPAGYTQNFSLPNLIIGPEAKVSLVDLRDNGNRGGGSEALYVDTLTFEDANGILNVNGLNLYYNTLVGDPLQIKDSQLATPSTWVCGSGNWNSTACWDQLAGGDSYPDNSASWEYSVFLPAMGGPYTVTANVSGIEVNTLDVDADATLNLTSTFDPGALTNYGVVEHQSSTLTLQQNVMNNGIVRYDTDNSSEYINIIDDVSLTGSGVLQSRNPSGSTYYNYYDRLRIYDTKTLTNGPAHTIEGGYLQVTRYNGDAAFVNDGEVRSNNSNRWIKFETSGTPSTFTITNNNLLAAENAGNMYFDGVAVTNTGTILADGADSNVSFYSDTTLDSTTGTLQMLNDGKMTISSTVASAQDFGVVDNPSGVLEFNGSLVAPGGTWVIGSGYGDFSISSGAVISGVTFESPGGPVIKLTGSCDFTDIGIDSTATLEIQSGTQDMAGTIVNDGVLRFDDDNSYETIAFVTDVLLGGSGVLQSRNPSGSTYYNHYDRLSIHDTMTLTNGPDHTIEGGYLMFRRYSGNAAFVNNGAVRSNNGRWIEFETTGAPSSFTIANNNLLAAENAGNMHFDGVAVTNAGTILADGADSDVSFYTDSTLDGGTGTLQMLNDGKITISSTMASAADFGTVDNPSGSLIFTGTLDEPGGTWTIGGNYGDFTIGSAHITGITFASADGHPFRLTSGPEFTDTTIDASATVENESASLYLFGTFTNNGLLRFDTDSTVERVYANGDIVFDGAGAIQFRNEWFNPYYGDTGDSIYIYDTFTVTNGPDHTMVGGNASILRYNGSVAFVNQGEIRCNLDRVIEFDSRSNAGEFLFTNDGDMFAENGGELHFEDVAVVNNGLMHADGVDAKLKFEMYSTVDSTNGTLRATNGATIDFSTVVVVDEIADLGTIDAAGGIVKFSPTFNQPGETWVIDANYGDLTLQTNTALTGITIQSPDNHLVKITASPTEFTDVTIDGAVIEIWSSLNLHGTFTNNGTIRTDSDSYDESINISADLNLAGSGTLRFQNTYWKWPDRLGLDGTITVTNTANHTIEGGSAYIYRISGDPVFINDGHIRANVSGTAFSTYNPSGNYTNFSLINNNLMVAENGGDLTIQTVTLTNNGTMTADGSGSKLIFSSTARLDNSAGLLQALDSGEVEFNTFTTTDGGNLAAGSGGEVELNSTTLATDGTITIDGGLLDLNNTTLTGSSTLLLSNNGEANFDSNTTATFDSIDNDGRFILSEATVTCNTYTGAGELTVTSGLDVDGLMTIESGSDVSVGNGDRITVGGNYDLQMVFDINYSYGSSGELRMTGGVTASPHEFGLFATLEVAGQDLDENDDPTQGSSAGFVSNFSLPELIVGPSAKLKLVDLRDNDHRGGADGLGNEPEAIYVDTLTFEDGDGVLALNGYRIYYNSTNAGMGQIVIGVDCNTNGIADNTDIAGGTSQDCNNNNVPDECDISGSTSEDCNSNSIPDECDIAAMTSFDINGNNIPDECEDDCNTNGTPDAQDISGGTSQDCNYNGVPDECEPGADGSAWIGPDGGLFGNPVNWDPTGVPTVAVTIANATAVDNTCIVSTPGTTTVCHLLVEASGTGDQGLRIDTGATLQATQGTTLATGSDLDLRGGTMAGVALTNAGNGINGYGTITTDVDNQGVIEGSPIAPLTLNGSVLNNQAGGTILAPTAATIVVTATSLTQAGRIEVQSNGSVVFDEPLVNLAGAEIELLGGTLDTAGLTNDATGNIDGFGAIASDLTNDGAVTIIADTQIIGDLVNDGTMTLQSGTLTVTGNVSGSGEFIGDFSKKSRGNGFTVLGDYAVGRLGSLAMGAGVFKAGGDFDNAINDTTRFDFTGATLQMVGLPEDGAQHLEAMAPDIGRYISPLPSRYLFSLDKLRIGPTATTVQLVDARDNSSSKDPEALYVNELIIEPGTTLDLAGLRIYYMTVTPPDPFDPGSGVTVNDSVGGGDLLQIRTGYNSLQLNVAAGSECVTSTDTVTVTLDVVNLVNPIDGVQALIHYDATYLSLDSITAESGWSLIVPTNPNDPDPDDDGDVTCALYLPGGEMSTNGTVATLVFSPVIEGATNVTFQADNPPFYTKLTLAADSSTVLPEKQDSGVISIDDTVATAGSNSPVCEGDTIRLDGGPGSGPDGPYTYSWAGTNGFSSIEQNPVISDATLAMNGTYTLTVTNGSGCEFVAQTVVEVYLCMVVNVEIEGLIGDNPGGYGPPSSNGTAIDREVTFVFTDCDGATATHTVPVTFAADTVNNKGVGSVIFTGLDAGFEWLGVQEGHTLRKRVAVDFVGTLADSVTVFLTSGDFHTAMVPQDNLVDITDFSILASNWETAIGADQSTGGDATGDGYHDGDDFALIQPNFFEVGDAVDDCGRVGRVPPAAVVANVVSRTPRAGISVSELSLTVAHAERADLDGNGVVDARDIRAFAHRHNLPLQPAFETRLLELEAELIELEPATDSVLEAAPSHRR